jgi:tetratricopeptide (TPR) repeat protein
MDVLVYLASRAGQIVHADELLEGLWPGKVVTSASVYNCITELRHAFQSCDDGQPYVDTIPKRGYRLVAPVTGLKASKATTSQNDASPFSRRMGFIVISLLCAAVLMFAYDKWWATGPPIRSLAVLPFIALGVNTELGYLADVMTVELGNELGRIDQINIRSRSSADRYKVTDKLLPQIASELRVDALVEGSIQQLEDGLRISLQLVDGRTDRQLWSEVFHSDLGDFLTLQGEVARAIANQIEIELTPETEARLTRGRKTSPESLKLLAVGNHLLKEFDPSSFQRALRVFSEAVSLDPEFAEAYAGIGNAYVQLGGWHGSEKRATILPLARSAANKAIHLDPDLAAGHLSQAQILRMEWDWQAAERAYKTGRELNPSGSIGLLEFANFLTAIGRTDEAIEIAREVVELDPLSPTSYNELGFALQADGQMDAALQQYQQALQFDPAFVQTNSLLADLYILAGQFDKAIPHLDRQRKAIEPQSWTSHAVLGLQYGQVGQHDETRKVLSLLIEKTKSEYVPAMAFAYLYLGLEDYDEAFNWLEAAYKERDMSLVWLKVDRSFDVLRDDARFHDLVARMNFPD